MHSKKRQSAWLGAARRLRVPALTAAVLLGTAPIALAQLTTEKDVQQRLESEGYTQVRDVKFGAEVITAKAVKDGKEWSLAIDSNGKVMQMTQGY